MLMVIFGAGASYDSASDYPPNVDHDEARPPLANELFDNRSMFRSVLAQFWECQPLVSRLHHPDPSLEAHLELAQSQAEEHPIRHQQLAAIRFYLREIIWRVEGQWANKHRGVTNHKTLLDDLERWRRHRKEEICLVTFNYDQMIEAAMPQVEIAMTDLGSYVNDPRYKLIKVHGSVTWVREVDGLFFDVGNYSNVAHQLIANASTLRLNLSSGIEIIPQPHITTKSVGQKIWRGLFPAIAIPVVQKSGFECPVRHEQALRAAIPHVTRILTIGWRGTEQHFLSLLRENFKTVPKSVMIVAGNKEEAIHVETNLRAAGVGQSFVTSDSGFSEAIRNREIDRFLWQE
jgi:hypothetical protein